MASEQPQKGACHRSASVLRLTGCFSPQDSTPIRRKGKARSRQDRDRTKFDLMGGHGRRSRPGHSADAASDAHLREPSPPPQGHVARGEAECRSFWCGGGAINRHAGAVAAAGRGDGRLAGDVVGYNKGSSRISSTGACVSFAAKPNAQPIIAQLRRA